MSRYEANHAVTDPDELRRILATDFGVDPEQIHGFVVVLATDVGDGMNMRPAVRTSVGPATAGYLLTAAAAEMQFLSLSDSAHPDHGDVCPDDTDHDQH